MNDQELKKKVKSMVHNLEYTKGYVAPVDVLISIGILTKKIMNYGEKDK